MKTDLAPIFAPILERQNGAYQLYPSAKDEDDSAFAEYERLRNIVRHSPAMKVSASVQDADSLWRFTRIGAILGEVALLNGTAPKGSEGIADRLGLKVSEDAYIKRILWFSTGTLSSGGHKKPNRSSVTVVWFFFLPAVLFA